MRKSLFTLSGLLAAVMMVAVAQAAPQSVGVQPLRNEVALDPGSSAMVSLELLNRESTEVTVVPSLEAYKANDDYGFPIDGETESDDPQNILNWVSLDKSPVTIPPLSKVPTSFKVTVPADAEPGGQYAAVFYEPIDEASGEGISVKGRVASLLLVTINGERIEEGVMDFSAGPVVTDKPVSFNVNFKNNGNVHLKPFGRITLYDGNGDMIKGVGKITDKNGEEKVVDYLPVNPNMGNVLPGSSRVFAAEWKNSAYSANLMAALEVEYGTDRNTMEGELALDLSAGAEVSNFKYDGLRKEFSFDIKNTAEAAIKPDLKIAIFNSSDFQIDEVSFKGGEYVEKGASSEVVVPWDKDAPNGRYEAKLAFVSPMLADVTASAEFSMGNPILSHPATPYVAVVIVLVIIALIWMSRKKK